MGRPVNLAERAMEHKETDLIPRAELWLGSEIFKEYDLEDNFKGHVRLRELLGMDLLFMPISRHSSLDKSQGYRYFSLEEFKKASDICELPAGMVIDGPFQKLSEKKGLMNVFSEWIKNRASIEREFSHEATESISLITDSLDLHPFIVVIADDIAYEKGLYISDKDLDRLFRPFYSHAVDLIHDSGAYALYHSCGNLTGIIKEILSYGFDGLAACQGNSMDLLSLKKEFGSRLAFLSGINAELLQTDIISDSKKKYFIESLKSLASGGGFILGSSCGLYSKAFLKSLSVLYEMSEGIKIQNQK